MEPRREGNGVGKYPKSLKGREVCQVCGSRYSWHDRCKMWPILFGEAQGVERKLEPGLSRAVLKERATARTKDKLFPRCPFCVRDYVNVPSTYCDGCRVGAEREHRCESADCACPCGTKREVE